MAKRRNQPRKSESKGINTDAIAITLKSFFTDNRVKMVTSLFSLLFAIFLGIAFTSFFFTWTSDYSKLNMSWIELVTNPDISVDNWAGKTGAAIAKQFIHNWFGIASYSFIFILILISFKLINVHLLPFYKSLSYALGISIWLSITMGFLFGDYWDANLGGAHGYFMSKWLNSFVGKFGTAFLLIISAFGFILYNSVTAYIYFNKLAVKTYTKTTGLLSKTNENKSSSVNGNSNQERGKNLNDDSNQVSDDNPFTIREEFIVLPNGTTIPRKAPAKGDDLEIEINDTRLKTDDLPELTDTDNPFLSDIPDDALVLGVNNDVEVADLENLPREVFDPTLELPNYKLPPVSLLIDYPKSDQNNFKAEINLNSQRIRETLRQFKIEIVKINAELGPTITLYEIVPAAGVRIAKIKSLENDIALRLAAPGIRIIAPLPGRGTVGIEVPLLKPDIVGLKTVLSTVKFQESKFELPIALGKTIANEPFVTDLTKMPHLLVAGATGQGKSVGLNVIIASILYKKHPAQVKFVLIDPKKVELSLYESIERHFLAKLPDAEEAIITNNDQIMRTLGSLLIEMNNRYDLLKKAGVRDIREYNARFTARRLNPNKGHKFLPYIVVIIDEFADMIMTSGKQVEHSITRLAQLARATGIHLIVATQRPSTNIITGTIKANFASRIAFKVVSQIDSRTILDATGANQLVGRGDMLITQGTELVRLQCPMIETSEIEKLTEHIITQPGVPSPFILPDYIDPDSGISSSSGDGANADPGVRDDLFEEAARIVVSSQLGSTSNIQRKLSIGFNRAGRIMDQLEAARIVGPQENAKPRQVYIPDEYTLEQYLRTLDK